MMGRNILIVTIALLLTCCAGTKQPALTEEEHLSMAIKKMGWDVVTSTNITCMDFDEIEPTYIIRDSSIVKSIMQELDRMSPREAKQIDVRCKLYILVNDSVKSTICLSKYVALYDGATYTPTPELIELIDKETENASIDSLSAFHYSSCDWEADKDRFYKYLQSQSHRLIGSVQNTLNLNVRIRLSREGKCLEVVVKHKGQTVPESLVTELEHIFRDEFKWSPCPERMPSESMWFPVTICNFGKGL